MDGQVRIAEQNTLPGRSRQQLEQRRLERQYSKRLAAFLSHGGMEEHVARSVMNGGQLFPTEDERASSILEEQIRECFDGEPDFKPYSEPVSLECLDYMFSFISQEPPESLWNLYREVIKRRMAEERTRMTSLEEAMGGEIAKLEKEQGKLASEMKKRWPMAVLSFASVVAGIVILFIGFRTWALAEIVVGLGLLSPAVFLAESEERLIQLRGDQIASSRLLELDGQIGAVRERFDTQREKLDRLKARLKTFY
jgi:hypothetical protein